MILSIRRGVSMYQSINKLSILTLENKMILCFYIENLNNHQQDWKDERVEKNNICGKSSKVNDDEDGGN
jgi:hypothetical protein